MCPSSTVKIKYLFTVLSTNVLEKGEGYMKISTKGRYALRLMLDLATEGNGKPVSIKDIAGRQDISEKYLEQIISSLNRAGYVKSVRGSQGGYLLKMDPKEYTVGMILRVTEGSLAPVDCAEDGSCDRVSTCATAMLWKKISDAVNDVVDHTTLADLLEWQQDKEDYCLQVELNKGRWI